MAIARKIPLVLGRTSMTSWVKNIVVLYLFYLCFNLNSNPLSLESILHRRALDSPLVSRPLVSLKILHEKYPI
jgi:hypothetical protein